MISNLQNCSKVFKHISTCNSPHPAIINYPVSSVFTVIRESALDKFFRPSTNFGKSAGFFGETATLNIGATEYFIDLIGYGSNFSIDVIVPVLTRYSSIPVRATVFPHGTSEIA